VNVNGNTTWDNNESLSSLTTSSVVQISGSLDRADATIDADEVAILSQNGFYASGQVTYVTPASGAASSFDLYVRSLLPASTGLTLRRHPLALLRGKLSKRGVIPNQELWERPSGGLVTTAGLVITRQRPGSAGGVTFVTLEDETGYVNLIVWERVATAQRAALLESRLLLVRGKLQREGDVQHVIAQRLTNLSALLGDLAVVSRNFH